MSRFRIVLIVTALCSLWPPTPAHPQEPNDMEELLDMSLEELLEVTVVTPSRKLQSIDKAPANITVITEKEIKDSGAQTLSDLLGRLPGVYIPTQGHGEDSMYIRSVGERYNDKTLLLFDGYPLRDLYYSTYSLNETVPLANIDHIEVIRGPGSSLYGTNAFAGVINIITKAPKDIGGTEVLAGLGIRGSHHEHVLWGNQDEKGGLSILARYLDSDMYSLRFDESGDPSGKTRYIRNSAVHFKGHRGNIDFQAGFYRTKLPDFMEAITDVENETQDTAFFRLGYTKDITERLNMRTRTYANLHWLDGRDLAYDGGALDKIKESSRESQIYGLDTQWRYQLAQNNDLLFGATYEYENLDHSWSREFDPPGSAPAFTGWVSAEPGPVPTSISNQNLAVYAEDEMQLIEGVLSVTAGARLDNYEETGSRLSPRVVAVWEPIKGTVVKGLYGEAFRSPSYRELYKQSDDGENEGNTNLDPEIIKTTELNLIQRLGNNHRLEVSLFRNETSDFIKTLGDGNYTNLKSRETRGIELGLKGQFPQAELQYFANYTNLDADENDGSDVDGLPEQMFTAGLTYEALKCVSISPYFQYIGKRNRPADYQTNPIDDGKTLIDLLGSFALFNVAAHTTKAFHPDIELAFAITNVFDEKYYTVSEKSYKFDVERPGRSFWMTLRYRF